MGYGTDGLTFNTLREANERRNGTCTKFAKCAQWTEADWFMALVGEVGELGNILKKIKRGDDFASPQAVRDAIADEIADVQVYLDHLAANLGVDLGRATMRKFNTVSKRVRSPVYIGEDGDWHLREAEDGRHLQTEPDTIEPDRGES
jgi:NTP pyrophosphatase (non-canonical NTP hydrolase)